MILIVDDDPAQRRITGAMLTAAGRSWTEMAGGQAALDHLLSDDGADVALVLLDLAMPGMNGVETLEALRPKRPDLPVLVLSSKGSVVNAVAAMRAGADDFLIKPVAPERLEVSVRTALKIRSLSSEVRRLSSPAQAAGFDGLIAAAEATRAAIRIAARGARSKIPMLIEGESGVGKEVFARAIHVASPVAEGPFVAVNCGALPEALVESILFGHEKGAFTGAVAQRIGKFQEADGGTLFLDEVGELPKEAQVKLLRAVQEGEVDPVGGAKTVSSDFRLISATNRDLSAEVAGGGFRQDLYYRLSVFPLVLPPLRERRADIAPLAELFAARFAAEEGRRITGLTPGARAALEAAPWPGNVRELENCVYRAVVVSETSELREEDFIHLSRTAPAPDGGGEDGFFAADGHIRPMAEIEMAALSAAMARYDGRLSEVARRLRIGRSTLYRKLQERDGVNEESGAA